MTHTNFLSSTRKTAYQPLMYTNNAQIQNVNSRFKKHINSKIHHSKFQHVKISKIKLRVSKVLILQNRPQVGCWISPVPWPGTVAVRKRATSSRYRASVKLKAASTKPCAGCGGASLFSKRRTDGTEGPQRV